MAQFIPYGDPAVLHMKDDAAASEVQTRIARIASSQIDSGPKLAVFIKASVRAIEGEAGHAIPAGPKSQFNGLLTAASGTGQGSLPKMSYVFGELRNCALSQGATRTADAIRSAAKWFWINVEGGSTPAPAGGNFLPSAPAFLPSAPASAVQPAVAKRKKKGGGAHMPPLVVPLAIIGISIITVVAVGAALSRQRKKEMK